MEVGGSARRRRTGFHSPEKPALRRDPLLLLPTSLGVLAGHVGQMLGCGGKGPVRATGTNQSNSGSEK